MFQLLKKHFARYTPEFAADMCGCTPQQVIHVAEALCQNSGRERTSAIVYAVGWTQHSIGVQMIRCAGIIQLLLGNAGRPGGGIMAMRGHASIQGSTDIPTLYDMLPGYLPMPVADRHHEKIDDYVKLEGLPTGYWANTKKFAVSLLKAWYGQAATPDNDYCFNWIPRIDGDYSQLPYFDRMTRGEVNGYFVFGQNPAGGAPNAGLHRAGLRQLDWLVVLDWFQHVERRSSGRTNRQAPPPEQIKTEVFFIPVAGIAEKEGTLTNTQRLIQFHDKAIDPPDDCRSDLWFVYNLGKKIKKLYEHSTDEKDAPIKALTWDYDYEHEPKLPNGRVSRIEGEPDANRIIQEINGYKVNEIDPRTGKAKLLGGFSELKDDGLDRMRLLDLQRHFFPSPTTTAPRTTGSSPTIRCSRNGRFAWPHNRRIMYSRAGSLILAGPAVVRAQEVHLLG